MDPRNHMKRFASVTIAMPAGRRTRWVTPTRSNSLVDMRICVIAYLLMAVACGGSVDKSEKGGKELLEGLSDAQSSAFTVVHKMNQLAKGEDFTAQCQGAAGLVADAEKASHAVAVPATAPANLTSCFASVDARRGRLTKALAAVKTAQDRLSKSTTAEAQLGECGAVVDALQELRAVLCSFEEATNPCVSEAKAAKIQNYLGSSPLSVECIIGRSP
jgi:hypothetical protein